MNSFGSDSSIIAFFVIIIAVTAAASTPFSSTFKKVFWIMSLTDILLELSNISEKVSLSGEKIVFIPKSSVIFFKSFLKVVSIYYESHQEPA